MQPSCIVFGASGYIGSHVAEQLVKLGFRVSTPVRATSNTEFLQSLGTDISIIDFDDHAQLHAAICGHDVLYNCLAEPKIHNSFANMHKVEITKSCQVMQAAAKACVKKFVQLSSIQAYGFSRPDHAIDEQWPLAPTYDFNKICQLREQALSDLANTLNLPLVILRPVTVIGQRDSQFKPIVSAHKACVFMTINGDAPFSAIDARDAGRAMAHLGMHASEGIYLAKGFDTSWLAFKNHLDQVDGRRALHINLPLRIAKVLGAIGDAMPYRFNPAFTRFSVAVLSTPSLFDDKKIRALGFAPKYTLEDALSAYR